MSKNDETKKVVKEENEIREEENEIREEENEIREAPVVKVVPQESKVKTIWKKVKKPVLIGLAIILSGAIGYRLGSNRNSDDSDNSENTFNGDDFIEVDSTTES